MNMDNKDVENLRCAVIGILAALGSTAIFVMGLVALFRYSDLMINSVPQTRK